MEEQQKESTAIDIERFNNLRRMAYMVLDVTLSSNLRQCIEYRSVIVQQMLKIHSCTDQYKRLNEMLENVNSLILKLLAI